MQEANGDPSLEDLQQAILDDELSKQAPRLNRFRLEAIAVLEAGMPEDKDQAAQVENLIEALRHMHTSEIENLRILESFESKIESFKISNDPNDLN